MRPRGLDRLPRAPWRRCRAGVGAGPEISEDRLLQRLNLRAICTVEVMEETTAMTVGFAIVGACVGIGLVHLGLNVHMGQTTFDGPTAYVLAALGGAGTALVLRYAINETFGPVI